jgi:dolichol-phosphate mannosyltransferase
VPADSLPRMRTLIVSPTYEEAENVEEFLRRARAAVPDADILIVDDSSPDGTGDIARRVAAELGRADVLTRPKKLGLGEAYRAGFAWGLDRGYERLIQIDADLSHDPTALVPMLAALDQGADVSVGSRYTEGGKVPHWPWYRKALSRYANRYAGFVLGLRVRDATSGYRAYQANTLLRADYLTTRSKGYGFQIETAYRAWRAGCVIKEIPISFTDRVRGESKLTWHIFAEELYLVTWWGIRDRVFRRGTRIPQPKAATGRTSP